MFIVGLDLSINYSSYTVLDCDKGDYYFGSIVNDASMSKKKISFLTDLSETKNNMDVYFTSSAGNKTSVHQLDYLNCERMKLINYIEIATLLCKAINKITGKSENVIVGIEGFSYGSQGMAVFDVPMLTGIIRYKILENVVNFDSNRIFVFPPSDLKKEFGCKGNCDKGVIFREFIANPKTDSMKSSDFYKFIVENQNDRSVSNVSSSNKLIIESPFNDIIDSYLSVYKILKNIDLKVK